jgi:hypothetical protein
MVNSRPIELRVDLSGSDEKTFYDLKEIVQRYDNIEISVLGGSCRIIPDYCLNFYFSLIERPESCFVTTRLHCNCKEGAMAIALASNRIIPRYGSWYEISSIEKISEEFDDSPFVTLKKSAFTNTKLLHKIFGQYLEIPRCLDKKLPMESLKELGLPIEEVKISRSILDLA